MCALGWAYLHDSKLIDKPVGHGKYLNQQKMLGWADLLSKQRKSKTGKSRIAQRRRTKCIDGITLSVIL